MHFKNKIEKTIVLVWSGENLTVEHVFRQWKTKLEKYIAREKEEKGAENAAMESTKYLCVFKLRVAYLSALLGIVFK